MSEPIAVRVPDELRARLLERAGERPISEVLRVAVEAYLDGPPDAAPPDAPEAKANFSAALGARLSAIVLPEHFSEEYEKFAAHASLENGELVFDFDGQPERLDDSDLSALIAATAQRPRGAGGSGGGSPRPVKLPAPPPSLAAEVSGSQRLYEKGRAAAGGGTEGARRLQTQVSKEVI